MPPNRFPSEVPQPKSQICLEVVIWVTEYLAQSIMLSKPLTVGIIGGIGPEAANRLSQLIVELSNASSDREHIPVHLLQQSQYPQPCRFN